MAELRFSGGASGISEARAREFSEKRGEHRRFAQCGAFGGNQLPARFLRFKRSVPDVRKDVTAAVTRRPHAGQCSKIHEEPHAKRNQVERLAQPRGDGDSEGGLLHPRVLKQAFSSMRDHMQ